MARYLYCRAANSDKQIRKGSVWRFGGTEQFEKTIAVLMHVFSNSKYL
jgi:hypothetical protein